MGRESKRKTIKDKWYSIGDQKGEGFQDLIKDLFILGIEDMIIKFPYIGCNLPERYEDSLWELMFDIDGDFVNSHVLGGVKPDELKDYEFWWLFD